VKKKIIVLGSTGLIGHQIYNYLKNNSDYRLSNISFKNKLQDDTLLLDARNELILVDQIKKIRPTYIINCIGVLIAASNKDPENAIYINAYLPHRLAKLADEIKSKLIHMSTDCVFSGRKIFPYLETDEKDGEGFYAKSKGLGEFESRNHLILRTSVVGPEIKSDSGELFHWFMNQHGSINGFTKAIWSGVTTIELAKAVKWGIDSGITGLYHITNNDSICKYDLLNLFKKYTGKEIEIVPINGKEIYKNFIDTKNIINYNIPPFDQMIAEMVEQIRNNKLLYSQYSL